MAERMDEWPRVHSCLNSWCPHQNPDCERCDKVCRLIMDVQELCRTGAIPSTHQNSGAK